MKRSAQTPASFTDGKLMSTINVRIETNLKTSAEEVLAREGSSVTDAVRKLYLYLDTKQSMPDFLKSADKKNADELVGGKRAALQNLVERAPSVSSHAQLKDERLSKQLRSGVL
jgi:antitoxin component of RelBE/YafQ-DinJ toxin-antitoxin module